MSKLFPRRYQVVDRYGSHGRSLESTSRPQFQSYFSDSGVADGFYNGYEIVLAENSILGYYLASHGFDFLINLFDSLWITL